MDAIIVDPQVLPQLQQVSGPSELRDPQGRLLGHFLPATAPGKSALPAVSEEELDRREYEGGGRSLAEILADLENRQ